MFSKKNKYPDSSRTGGSPRILPWLGQNFNPQKKPDCSGFLKLPNSF